MSNFETGFKSLKHHQSKVDYYTSRLDEVVNKVLKKIYTLDYFDKTKYDTSDVAAVLVGTDSPPLHFDEFNVNEDDQVEATGTYYGARGWTSAETVTFPVSWTELDDEQLEHAIRLAWSAHLLNEEHKKNRDAEREQEQRYQKFLELQKEFS